MFASMAVTSALRRRTPHIHALRIRLIRSCMDECDAQLGAHQRQMLGAVVGAVIDVQALRQSTAHQRMLEHRQERGGVLGQGERGVGHHAGGVVEEGDEVGLAPGAPGDGHGRTMHDIAHPQLAGVREGEAAPIGGRGGIGALAHQALAREQAMHARHGQHQLVGQRSAGACLRDDAAHRQCRVLLLDRDQQLGHVVGDLARPAAVGTRLGAQRIEAAGAVALEPVADGLGGDAGAGGAGDGVLAHRLLVDALVQPRGARRQAREFGNHAVAEQGYGMAVIGGGCVGHGVGLWCTGRDDRGARR